MAVPKTRSVAFKLLAVSAVAISLVLAITFFVVIMQVRERTVAMTLKQAETNAEARGESIGSKIGTVTGAVVAMASTIEKGLEHNLLKREDVVSFLKSNIESFDLVFASWMVESELGFDGKRGPIASIPMGTNDDGQFIAAWQRRNNGPELAGSIPVEYDAPFYAIAAKTLKTSATEPYQEPAANNILMMSIAHPVIVDGKLRGVSGIDVALGTLAEMLENQRPFGTGRIYLLSGNGKWLTAPDASLVMNDYASESAAKVKTAVAEGKPILLNNVIGADGHPVYRIISPFSLPGLDTKWAVVEDVPVAAISSVVNEQTRVLLLGGLIVLIAVLGALFLAVRAFIQKPMAILLGEVSRLSEGDFDQVVEGQARHDEIGDLAKALERFRHGLADGRTMEANVAEQRRVAEGERKQREAERASEVEQQQSVVEALGRGLSRLADGDLTCRISEAFPTSYVSLKDNFNITMDSLEATILQLHSTVGTLNAGISEISRSSDQLSRRTEQQAANLEETAAAMNEVSEQISTSARNAAEAASKVGSACTEADESTEVVKRAIAAMRGIEASSDRVSQIIGVIDEIAFQTNLLALNAGVEAARAGEAGKGFAVVAQEVRELAQRSAQAAREIKQLISASSSQVEIGVGLVGETGSALDRIAGQVSSINLLIQEISSSSREQALGLREINNAVNHMDQVTQQNAAMVEETNAAAGMLDIEAKSLREMVSAFTVSAPSAKQPRRVAA